MPLDDREQRILAEIERQFYQDDPDLANAVRNISRPLRFGVRMPLVGLIIGIVLVIVTFQTRVWLALLGFLLMVGSATILVGALRARGDGEGKSLDIRNRWPFRRT